VAADFRDVDLSRTTFREVDLTGVHMRGVILSGGDIDGAIDGLRINGVDVAPLIEAELDRLHPERRHLKATTADGLRAGWDDLEAMWSATLEQAGRRPESDLHVSVDDEWSFAETLRHLIFVTDAWFGHAVLEAERPFHPIGLPASFMSDVAEFGIDVAATPTFAEVMEVRQGRLAQVRAFLADLSDEDLEQPRGPNHAPGWPPPSARAIVLCLHVLFNEEWAHHQFATRDLARLDISE
jgi:uncharacterized protein YjbI with pentapeptide repeats